MIGANSRHILRTHAGSQATAALARLALGGLTVVFAQMTLTWLTRELNHQTATSVSSVLPLLVGLAGPTAVLLVLAPRIALLRPCRLAVLIVFLAGLAMRLVWFGGPTPLEDDFQRYLWDGAVVASGLDPYRYPPEQFLGAEAVPHEYSAVAAAGQETLNRISFPDLRTIYPSSAQFSFAIAHMIAPFSIEGLRIVFLFAEVTTFFLILAMLSVLKISALWSVLYWWNPMAAFSVVGLAHVDALVPAFVLAALLMMVRYRTYSAAAFLGIAAGVKIWPVLLLPLVLARVRREPLKLLITCVTFAIVLAAAIGPLALSALHPGSGLTAYALSWGNNNAFFAWAVFLLSHLIDPASAERALRVFVGLSALAISTAVTRRADSSPRHLVGAYLIVTAAVFYLSPAQFPWYAVWFLPLAAIVRNWPLLLASATLPFYYLFYPFWADGRGDAFFFGAAFLHSVPVLAWLAWEKLNGRPAGCVASRERMRA